ncbi:hypothetical protein K440DRAFT_638874 [Wilcoxina mikolae CBS 423.85]|nr:hypothetical protein K440DRAFT_638874 [Wilcoxina mikolae CBS 423.85]
MVLDPLSTVGLVSNIVQFVDFASKILSKSRQLCLSADGVLSENVDTESVTQHLLDLPTGLQGGAGDPALEKLCLSCNEVAEELLCVLGKLKVEGKNGTWKSLRKALKSMRSKEEIEEIEKRLAAFREELSLHIVVDPRNRIDLLSLQQSHRFELLDESSKSLLDAVINNRDEFQSALLQTQKEELAEMQHQSDATVREEYAITRSEIADAVRTVDDHNRNEIAQLKEALKQLSEEIKQRDSELRGLLLEFAKANNSKKRKMLQERGNAVYETLLALETIYRTLQVKISIVRELSSGLDNMNRNFWQASNLARRK